MNQNILNQIKINELNGDDYIVTFSKAILDMGYHECQDIMYALQRRFPQKTFLGVPENIEFKKFDTKELKQIIDFIQKEIDSREASNEQPGTTDTQNS